MVPSLLTSDLQFVFKKRFSAHLCSGLLKNCEVYGWFFLLDASKAFDLVNHNVLFGNLLKRKLPIPILWLLFRWYIREQSWNSTFSISFVVSNGFEKGVATLLFSVY